MSEIIAKYLRLSLDDENAVESNSIAGQRQLIDDYIDSVEEFSGAKVVEFKDDGYSGTNFNRPDVKRLLEAVRRGEVGCIIVKDFSRFGRQYLEVSKFIEQIFPYLGVRFIAVNDHYDSNSHKGTTAELDVPVRNMINAMYSRDISKKVKSAKQTQMRQGVFSNAFASYGYIKDKTDRHRLLIDEPAAEIVRRIFTLADEGYSGFQIASGLNADGVLTPAQHKKQGGSKLAVSDTDRAIWTLETVSRILRDERYTGTFVGGKRENGKLGTGSRRKKPNDEWIRVPGAHPAIITAELFDAVNVKRQKFAGAAKPNTSRTLYKKVRCGHCGHVLQYIGDSPKPYYLCDTVRYTDQYGCRRGRFRELDIINDVREVVQSQVAVMFDLEGLCRDGKKELKQSAMSADAAAARLDNEIKQLQAFKRQLYERYKGGSLEREAYFKEREALEADISAKTSERNMMLARSHEQSGAVHSAHEFLCSFKKYQAMPEISDAMVDELVEVVYVYDTDRIEVRFSFGDELERAIGVLEEFVRKGAKN